MTRSSAGALSFSLFLAFFRPHAMAASTPSPSGLSTDQLAAALAEWMAAVEPAPALPAGFMSRHANNQALEVWLFSSGEFSLEQRFLSDCPNWRPDDWARARDALWGIATVFDLGVGAPGVLHPLKATFGRAREALAPEGRDLVFWQAAIGSLGQQLSLLVEGAFPKEAFERAVLRSAFPAFAGCPTEAQRQAMFCDRVLAVLNGEGLVGAQPDLRGVHWASTPAMINSPSLLEKMAQTAFPGSRGALFSLQARAPVDFSKPGPAKPTLAQFSHAISGRFALLQAHFARCFGDQTPLALRVQPVEKGPPSEELIAQIGLSALSAERQARLFAALELAELRRAIPASAARQGGILAPSASPKSRRV